MVGLWALCLHLGIQAVEPATARAPGKPPLIAGKKRGASPLGREGRGPHIIRLVSQPVASYAGDIASLPATSPRAAGVRNLDVETASARSYRKCLAAERARVLTTAERVCGRQMAPVCDCRPAAKRRPKILRISLHFSLSTHNRNVPFLTTIEMSPFRSLAH